MKQIFISSLILQVVFLLTVNRLFSFHRAIIITTGILSIIMTIFSGLFTFKDRRPEEGLIFVYLLPVGASILLSLLITNLFI